MLLKKPKMMTLILAVTVVLEFLAALLEYVDILVKLYNLQVFLLLNLYYLIRTYYAQN